MTSRGNCFTIDHRITRIGYESRPRRSLCHQYDAFTRGHAAETIRFYTAETICNSGQIAARRPFVCGSSS